MPQMVGNLEFTNRIYKLKAREQIPDLFNIIDYKIYQDKYDEEHNEDTEEASAFKEMKEVQTA